MSNAKGGYTVLIAMIFAVGMTFIDQTIVSISIPEIQKELDLSSNGVNWVVNGYLLTLSALFAFGGKIADVAGRRTMVTLGVLIFATASALCGATPTGDIAEAWIIFFRIVQGAGAAIMFPAALAIVVSAFPIESRGKAMALFFGITGALTAVGPIAGGYLTEWTWRSIFWINIPVAIIALVLIFRSKPEQHKHPQPIDYRGAVLIAIGMGLAVLGLQQSAIWGWDDPKTWLCIAVGLAFLVVFLRFEAKQEHPLIRVTIFKDRAFFVDCVILGLMSIAFVPLFLFASMYSQISLGWSASEAGLYLAIFFGGFAAASQWGGRILDAKGARPSMILGGAIAAVGFFLWAQKLTDIDGGASAQWPFIVMAGAGIGLILGPVSTDAVNRAPNTSYGEATGITQTVRNFGASLGLAVLGSILITQNRVNLEGMLPKQEAESVANAISQSSGGGSGSGAVPEKILTDIANAFAESTQTLFYIMAGVMAVCFLVALRWAPAGKMEEVFVDEDDSPQGSNT